MVEDTSPPALVRGHEVADIDGRRTAWLAAGLVGALVVVALAAYAAHGFLRTGRASIQAPTQAIAATAPQLQTAPTLDLKALREEKGAMLDRYRWIDQGNGVVQIPIERAMQLAVERSSTKQTVGAKQTVRTEHSQ